jgi:hypothetical protein
MKKHEILLISGITTLVTAILLFAIVQYLFWWTLHFDMFYTTGGVERCYYLSYISQRIVPILTPTLLIISAIFFRYGLKLRKQRPEKKLDKYF